jgi:hypothetical protein
MVFINGSNESHTVLMLMISLLCFKLQRTPAAAVVVHQTHNPVVQIRALARIARNVKRSERRPTRIRTATKRPKNWLKKRKSSKRKTKRRKRRRRSPKNAPFEAIRDKWLPNSLLPYLFVIFHSSLLTPYTIRRYVIFFKKLTYLYKNINNK